MRESKIRQEIAGYRRGLVREGELTVRSEGPPTCRTERLGRVNGTRGRGFGVKKGWEEGKLERRRRTPVQPESAMREGAGEIEARAEGDVVVRACAEGKLGGGLVNMCRGGGGLDGEEI